MGSGDTRRGSDSRCCQPDNAPYSWVDHVDPSHPQVILFEAWFRTLTPFARAHEEGEVDDLFDAAARGELSDSGDATTPIKPVKHDPEIFELRKRALANNLRFYHAEPTKRPSSLLALHRHIKTGSRSQQVQIEEAAIRYHRIHPPSGA